MSFFPLARSVQLTEHRLKEPDIAALAYTHKSSWGEADLAPIMGEGGEVAFRPGSRYARSGAAGRGSLRRLPIPAWHPRGRTRLVVIGDADFASNQYFAQQANGELFLGSVSWLTEDEDRLTIADKQPAFNPINLIGNQGAVILWVSVFIVPFAVALSGMVMVLRRGYQTYV